MTSHLSSPAYGSSPLILSAWSGEGSSSPQSHHFFGPESTDGEGDTDSVFGCFSLTAKKMASVIVKLKLLKFSHAKFTKAKFK